MGPGLFLNWPKSCGRNFLLACPGLSLYNIHQNFGKEIFMNTRTMLILYFIVMNLIGLSAMVIDKIRAMER